MKWPRAIGTHRRKMPLLRKTQFKRDLTSASHARPIAFTGTRDNTDVRVLRPPHSRAIRECVRCQNRPVCGERRRLSIPACGFGSGERPSGRRRGSFGARRSSRCMVPRVQPASLGDAALDAVGLVSRAEHHNLRGDQRQHCCLSCKRIAVLGLKRHPKSTTGSRPTACEGRRGDRMNLSQSVNSS